MNFNLYRAESIKRSWLMCRQGSRLGQAKREVLSGINPLILMHPLSG